MNTTERVTGIGKSPEGCTIVTIEQYNELHERFLGCSHELERVKEALEIWQVETKRWRLAYRSTHRETPWEGLEFGGQRTEEPPRPRLAPETPSPLPADLTDRGSLFPEHVSSGENFLLLPRPERTKISPGLQVKHVQGSLEHKPEKVAQDDCSNDADDSGTPSSITQDDGSTELYENLGHHVPPMLPHDNSMALRSHSVEALQTKTAGAPNSDVPIVTLQRSLKRKRVRSPVKSSQKRENLKEELSSSSPIAIHASTVAPGVQESIDLDEISNRLYTPRKDQRKRQQIHRTYITSSSRATQSDTHHDESFLFQDPNMLLGDESDEVPMRDGGSPPDIGAADVQDEAWCHREGQKHAARLLEEMTHQRREEAQAKRERHNRRERVKHAQTNHQDAKAMQNKHTPGCHGPAGHIVLQPTNANKAIPRIDDFLTNQKKKPSPTGWHQDAHYINCLSEDGESGIDTENMHLKNDDQAAQTTTPINVPNPSKSVNAPTQQRLNQLLAGPSPDKPRLCDKGVNRTLPKALATSSPSWMNCKASTREGSQANAPRNRTRGLLTPVTGPRPRATPSYVITSGKTPYSRNLITPHSLPTYTTPFSKPFTLKNPPQATTPPLRNLPPSHLSLSDFKINPAQNQGYPHPFKETVRSRDQRKCLPGCTRLECCGTVFRKMAETGLFKPYPTSRLFASSQEVEDQRIMEDFLGDQAYRVRKMSKDDKAEVLLQAKTKILADHYGRHREVYVREPSPVGYWDVDMPNSQEAAEQKKMAEIRTRQKVEERYNEAMRKDGAWNFRDE